MDAPAASIKNATIAENRLYSNGTRQRNASVNLVAFCFDRTLCEKKSF